LSFLPLVTIIIPAYNREHLIGESLDSIIAQTYSNWECIIVDDGSTDGTAEVIKSYILKDARFKYFKRPNHKPKGANACRNFGLECSKGTFINWFDSDDIMHPKKLEIQIKLLKKNDGDLCVCNAEFFEGQVDNTIPEFKRKIKYNDAFNDYIQGHIKFFTPSLLIARHLIFEYSLSFDETLHRSQEFDFFAGVLAIHPHYCVVEKILVYIRKHFHSISYSGDVDGVKDNSIFMSRYKILDNFSDKLTKQSVSELTKKMLSVYLSSLRASLFDNASKQRDLLLKLSSVIGIFMRLKIIAVYISFRIFGKGEKLLKL
jgi:glycosyltransferase involved in cell wall biosynthesis